MIELVIIVLGLFTVGLAGAGIAIELQGRRVRRLLRRQDTQMKLRGQR